MKEAPCDFREFDSSTQIKSLTADIIDKVSCLCSSDDIDIELEQFVLFLIYNFHMKTQLNIHVLSCQPRVTVTSCFVYKVIRNL